MRLDEPGRDQAEEVEAPLFFVRRLMRGPLLSKRRVSLSEGGVALGELGLKRLCIRLEAPMRLCICLPFEALRCEIAPPCPKLWSESERNRSTSAVQLVEVRLIDLNRATTVEDARRRSRVRCALVFGGRPTMAHSRADSRCRTSLILRLSRTTAHVRRCLQRCIHTQKLVQTRWTSRPSRPSEFDPNNFWPLCPPLVAAASGRKSFRVEASATAS